MQTTGSDIDLIQSLTFEMYNYKFYMFNSINHLENDTIRKVTEDIIKFAQLEDFYSNHKHDYLNLTLNFVLKITKFFIKDGKFYYFEGLSFLIFTIVENIKKISNEKQCGEKYEKDIAEVLQLISLLLESHQMEFQVPGCKLLTEIIDIPFINFSEFNSLYVKAVNILNFYNQITILGNLFYAVINRKACADKSKIDFTPSYLDLEQACLNCLEKEINNEAEDIIIKCLIRVYNSKQFEFSSKINQMLPFLHKVCNLMNDPNYKNCVKLFIYNVITTKNYFPLSDKKIYLEIKKLSDKYQEWPSETGEAFFLVSYLFLMTSELVWSCQEILESISFYMQNKRHVSDSSLKAILMLYSYIVENISEQNTANIGAIILNHLQDHNNLDVILTSHKIPLTWIFKNADEALNFKVLESWFRIEKDEKKIGNIFKNIKLGHILVNYFTVCSNKSTLLKVSQIIITLKWEKELAQAIHQAISKVCSNVNKFGVLLRANFDMPDKPDTISKHLEILHVILPLLNEEASVTAGCNYFNLLMRSCRKFEVNVKFDYSKLYLLAEFLISVCCLSDDQPAIAAITLTTTLLQSNQLSIAVPLRKCILVPFREIIVGNSKRINCGIELLYQVLLQENSFLLALTEAYLEDLYKYLFEIVTDETVFETVKLFKLLNKIDPQSLHLISKKTIPEVLENDAFSEKTKMLFIVYFRFSGLL